MKLKESFRNNSLTSSLACSVYFLGRYHLQLRELGMEESRSPLSGCNTSLGELLHGRSRHRRARRAPRDSLAPSPGPSEVSPGRQSSRNENGPGRSGRVFLVVLRIHRTTRRDRARAPESQAGFEHQDAQFCRTSRSKRRGRRVSSRRKPLCPPVQSCYDPIAMARSRFVLEEFARRYTMCDLAPARPAKNLAR